MYRIRIPLGILLLSIIGGIYYWDYSQNTAYPSQTILALIILGALAEFYQLIENRGYKPYKYYGLICITIGLAGIYFLGTKAKVFYPWYAGYGTAMVAGVFLRALFDPDQEDVLEKTYCTLAGIFYIYFLLSYLLWIRGLGKSREGIIFLLLLILVAKGADIGGYLVGKAFGKHKLCPAISPKKSWEGLGGGIILSIAIMFAFYSYSPIINQYFNSTYNLIFAISISLLSLLGDLSESLFKRRCDVKDSNQLIPEFGGIMDLVDSLIFAAPAGYYFFIWLGIS